MGTLSPEEIEEVMAVGKTYIPVIAKAIDDVAPVLDKIITRMSNYMREQNVASIQFYEDHGLSHSEAILLCINANVALAEALKNTGKNKK